MYDCGPLNHGTICVLIRNPDGSLRSPTEETLNPRTEWVIVLYVVFCEHILLKVLHRKQNKVCKFRFRLLTHPRHKGEDVVLLVLDGVFRVLLLTFLRAAEPDGPGLQLLLPSTYVGQAVTAAERETHRFDSV